MRSVRPDGVEGDWHATAWMAAGFGLAAVGGFMGSLLREREALALARRSALTAAEMKIGGPEAVWRTVITTSEAASVARLVEARA